VSVTVCLQAAITEAHPRLVIGYSKSSATSACCIIRAVQ